MGVTKIVPQTNNSTAEVKPFLFWLRSFRFRFWVWLGFGYGLSELCYDLVTAPGIWLRYDYAMVLVTIWFRFKYKLDHALEFDIIWLRFGYAFGNARGFGSAGKGNFMDMC